MEDLLDFVTFLFVNKRRIASENPRPNACDKEFNALADKTNVAIFSRRSTSASLLHWRRRSNRDILLGRFPTEVKAVFRGVVDHGPLLGNAAHQGSQGSDYSDGLTFLLM